MNKHFLCSLVIYLIIMTIATTSHAGGYRITEQSASAMSMANAFTAQADDPSAVWYNPAGITQLSGTRVTGGVVMIFPTVSHDNNTINIGTTDVAERDLFVQPLFYVTQQVGQKTAFGFGINSPFGLATDWDPANSSTRYVSTYSKVITTQFNPNIAYKMTNRLSLAAGVDYVYLRATLEKTTPDPFAPVNDTNFRLSGDGDGWGFNAALRYEASDAVALGLSYRSRIKVDVEGDAEILGTPLAGPATTSITLPDLVMMGISYKATDRLIINADAEYTFWSTYDRLVISSDVPVFNTTEEKQWDDVWSVRLGAQYALSDNAKIRAGYLYDYNPVKEPYFENSVPDSDIQTVSVGVGYTVGRIVVDVGYSYARYKKRTISDSLVDDAAVTPKAPDALNGTYKTEAHLLGLSVGYSF